MFIKELAKHGSKMGVIAKNTEDYISFSVNVEVDKYIDKNGEECSKEITLRFIVSIKFLSSSLDSLVNNLAGGGGEFFGFENYTNILLIGEDSKKLPFLLRALFIVNLTCLELAIKIMNMPVKFVETLGLGTWKNTTIYIYELTSSFWQMYSNLSGRFVWIIMDWIQPTFIQPQDWHGKLI